MKVKYFSPGAWTKIFSSSAPTVGSTTKYSFGRRPKLYLSLPVFFCLVLATLWSCEQLDDLENIQGVQYDAEYAIPLANLGVSLDRILQNFEDRATLTVDQAGLFHFEYVGEVLTETGSEVFEEIEKTFQELTDITPNGIPVILPRFPIPYKEELDIEVDLIRLKAGQFSYQFESRNLEDINIQISLPQFFKDGSSLSFSHQLPAYDGTGDPPSFSNKNNPINLSEVEIVPVEDILYIEYTATNNNGELVPLNNVFIRFDNIKLSFAQGFLGTNVYDGPLDSIDIDFFDAWIAGDVNFTNPEITYILENSFGIPTRSIVNRFDIITVEGNSLALVSPLIENGIDFPYPNLNEIGQVKSEAFLFTKDNSNIDDILSSKPVEVIYDVDALTHPEGNREIRGFITDSSFYRVRVLVDLPLQGSAADFEARDTVEVSLDDFNDLDSVGIKIVAENTLPLAVDIQIFFVDENGVLTEMLADEDIRVIDAAPIDAEGKVTGSSKLTSFIPIAGSRLQALLASKELALRAIFSTPGEVPVQITNEQRLEVGIGAIFKISN